MKANSFYTDKDVYALANISELFYQQHEDNKDVYDAICEAEQNLKDAAEERETQGVWKTVAGVGLLVVGGVCIVASWGTATPIVAAAGSYCWNRNDYFWSRRFCGRCPGYLLWKHRRY